MAHPERLESVVLTGPPRERGVAHGETFADDIRTNIDTYLRWFDAQDWDLDRMLKHGAQYLSVIESLNEAYAEEMRGVAEGSGISLDEVTMLNARYEAMYPAYREDKLEADRQEASIAAESLHAECSTLGVQPEASADGHTYLGQNWDWLPDLVNVVLELDRKDGPNMVAMTEAGIVGGKTGVNEHGIGLGVNGLFTMADGKHQGRKPFHVRCREVLDATTMEAAVEAITATKRVCSANFLLGHESGALVDLETAPERVNVVYPDIERGFLGHSNHFTDRTGVDDVSEALGNTVLRKQHIERSLARHVGAIDVDVIKETLRDRFGALCKYPTEEEWADQTQTNCSFVLDLNERRMLGALGPPDRHDYHEYRVPS